MPEHIDRPVYGPAPAPVKTEAAGVPAHEVEWRNAGLGRLV